MYDSVKPLPRIAMISTCWAEDILALTPLMSGYPILGIFPEGKSTGDLISLSRIERRIREQLPPWEHLPPEGEIPTGWIRFPAAEMNTPNFADLLKHWNPDFLVTSGAPILRESIFSIPRVMSINVHWGVTPHYRGADSLFWSLYNRDWNHIGFTLHQIDSGIDTGRVFAQGFPALHPGDTEAELLIKMGHMAGTLLGELVALGNELHHRGRPMPSGGKLYRYADRKAHHDAVLQTRLEAGGIGHHQPVGRVRFLAGFPSELPTFSGAEPKSPQNFNPTQPSLRPSLP